MVSFLRGTAVALLASLASTEAAYGRVYLGSRPSVALGSRMPLVAIRSPVFSRSFGRIMGDLDEMFEAMLGDVEEKLYEPLLSHSRSRFSRGHAKAENLAKNTSGITQDENQVQIAVELPDTEASDINLQLEERSRLLKISGETKRDNQGISVHSRFERSFSLPRDVDTNKITAHMDGGVLTITAPKNDGGKEKTRSIDIVKTENGDDEDAEDGAKEVDALVSAEKEENEEVKSELDESVIDLDLKKDQMA